MSYCSAISRALADPASARIARCRIAISAWSVFLESLSIALNKWPEGPSVFRLRRVHLVDPVQDAAFEVAHALEPLLTEEVGSLGAAHARLALRDDLERGVQLAVPLPQLAEWNQRRALNAVDLVLL